MHWLCSPRQRPPRVLNRNRVTRHPRTIVTIAGTPPLLSATTVTNLPRDTDSNASSQEARGGAWRLPPLANLLCRLGSALEARMFRERRAPQKRCDQLWCSSKPGGVMFPPELNELTHRLYSLNSSNASEDLVNSKFPNICCLEIGECVYLMNRVSRSWSRPTKDFTVR